MEGNGNDLWNEHDLEVEDSAFNADDVEAVRMSDLKHALDFTKNEMEEREQMIYLLHG